MVQQIYETEFHEIGVSLIKYALGSCIFLILMILTNINLLFDLNLDNYFPFSFNQIQTAITLVSIYAVTIIIFAITSSFFINSIQKLNNKIQNPNLKEFSIILKKSSQILIVILFFCLILGQLASYFYLRNTGSGGPATGERFIIGIIYIALLTFLPIISLVRKFKAFQCFNLFIIEISKTYQFSQSDEILNASELLYKNIALFFIPILNLIAYLKYLGKLFVIGKLLKDEFQPTLIKEPPKIIPVSNALITSSSVIPKEKPLDIIPSNSNIIDKSRMDKLTKIMRISNRISIDDVIGLLKIERLIFLDFIIENSEKFHLKIEGNDLIFSENANITDFIQALDNQFSDWTNKEQQKMGKI
jgi:hypothetical protein